jgi:hypothetical protein
MKEVNFTSDRFHVEECGPMMETGAYGKRMAGSSEEKCDGE